MAWLFRTAPEEVLVFRVMGAVLCDAVAVGQLDGVSWLLLFLAM